MKGKNPLVLLCVLFFLSSLILGSAIAGDELNPEVEDDTGETEDPTKQFRDIDAGWFGGEDNATLTIYLKLAGAPPGLADLAQAQDTTTFEYEVYFDVEGKSYAVVAEIQYAASIGQGTPIGGVYSTSGGWNWELREVNYALGTDIIQSETSLGGLSDNAYSSDDVILEMEVNKGDIGIGEGFEGRGQKLENTWAAVWNADDNPSDSQRDPKGSAWDYAHTHHSDPGKPYNIKGQGDVDYNVELSVDESEKITFGGTPAEFLIRAHNNGSDEFLVDFTVTSPDDSWEVILNPNSTTIGVGTTRTISVSVTPPKDVQNGTILVVQIGGLIHALEGNSTIPILSTVTLKTIGLTPPDKNEDKGFLDNLIDMFKDNLAIIAGAIAIVIIAIIVLAVLIKR